MTPWRMEYGVSPSVVEEAEEVPFVLNTFLHTRPSRCSLRSKTVSPRGSCDRFVRELHILMYKTRPVKQPLQHRSMTPSMSSSSIDYMDATSDMEFTLDSSSEQPGFCSESEGSSCFSQVNQVQPAIGPEELEALVRKVPRDDKGSLTSIGSLGHVEGNCKPCVFAHHAQRPCANGVRCQFCHFPHPPKRRLRLCKRKRLELRRALEQASFGDICQPPVHVPVCWPVKALESLVR